jgi:hypothetical protein
MADDVSGAVVEPQIETKAESISKEDLQELLDKNNRAWQSKFDKVLTEKKTEESRAMSVEQRIAQIEAERQAERLDWARKEARATSQIDDDLDNAIKLYSGTDAESISKGAQAIKAAFDKLQAKQQEAIDAAVKVAIERVGSQPTPKGGASGATTTLAEFFKLDGKAQAAFIAAGGVIQE